MAKRKSLNGNADAGNPHVRLDEGEGTPAVMSRRGSLSCKNSRFNETLQRDHLVAFIDLLGWSDKLSSAKTHADIDALLDILKRFHGDFDFDYVKSLSAHERESVREQIEILSDALVVAVPLNCGDVRFHDQYEEIRLKFWDFALAQAQCAVEGTFIRGGVSLGYCIKGEGVILSDALVKAYELEGKVKYPVVAVSDELYEYWRGLPFYDEGEASVYTTVDARGEGSEFRFIDYINITLGILQGESRGMSEVEFLAKHKASIIDAIGKAKFSDNPDKVREKYEWLKRYHDKYAIEYGREFCF